MKKQAVKKKALNKKKVIKKKASLTKRVPIGIPGFDKLISGGFKRNSVNLVVGSAGAGKTIFTVQFLVNGIKKYNENVLYLTFEEKREKIFSDMKSFGWNLEELEKKKKFIILEYSPEQVEKLLSEGGGTVESLVEKHKVSRIVIDSITSFGLLYKGDLARKEATLALFGTISKWNCTALLTSENEAIGEENISSGMEFEADSIIILYHVKTKGVRQRAVEILKMRGTKHTNKTFELKIDEHGISINPNKVVSFD